jgi:hypothetical protein
LAEAGDASNVHNWSGAIVNPALVKRQA